MIRAHRKVALLNLSQPIRLELEARGALREVALVPVDAGWFYVPEERLEDLVEHLVALGHPPGFGQP